MSSVRRSTTTSPQPGRAPLSTIVKRWEKYLDEPDVGIFFDLRDHLARAGQSHELTGITRELRDRYPAMPVLARGAGAVAAGSIIVPEVLDLKVPGTPFPHVAFAATPRPQALVYM